METKNCQNCKNDFNIEPEDFLFYEKIKVPPPTFCQYCRAERRFSFRNEKKLFKIKDAFTGKDIFSLYPTECKKKIISHENWHSDQWNAEDYALDYDFSKTFFEQFNQMEMNVPVLAMRTQMMVNSPYCANATGLKNCYLCFASSYSEDSMYNQYTDYSKDCIDNSHVNHSERCYESFWLQSCYQCHFTIMSVESSNLWFCRDCLGCNDCIGCTNLRKSSYCIFNVQYTKEEYKIKIDKMKLNTTSGVLRIKEISRNFWLTQPNKNHQGLRSIDSTGSYITDCKDVNDSYIIRESENMRYCQYMGVPKNKDCYDANTWGFGMELHYETVMCGDHSFNIKFSLSCWPACKNIEYSMYLLNCSDCFGCVGLKKKQYCILNKQYTKKEYFEMIEKIKKHMDDMPYLDRKGNIYKYGEYFPVELSPFGYNNTIAIQHFEMNKEDASKFNYPWIEVEKGRYTITKKIGDVPDDINDIYENILEEVIECSQCKSAYKIIENEFIFYKKENLPIPIFCNDCRYEKRIKDRLKIFLFKRKCMCNGEGDITGIYKNTCKHIHGDNSCGEEFKTGYSPDRLEIIYCEKCYQQEVI